MHTGILRVYIFIRENLKYIILWIIIDNVIVVNYIIFICFIFVFI